VLLDLEREQHYWDNTPGWKLRIEEEASPIIAA